MAQRRPGQSQLDYLWENFGEFSKFKNIRVQGDKVQCLNDQGEELFLLNISGLSSTGQSSIQEFDKKEINGKLYYYIKLSDGTEFKSPIDSVSGSETECIILNVENNIISGKLKLNNEDSLIVLKETEKGLKVEINDSTLQESLQLIKDVSENITELKESIKQNSDTLVVLNGDENQIGSVLNTVSNCINSALEWETFIN